MGNGKHRFSGPKYANGNHKSQQKAYVRTEKGKRIARNATRLNRKLGTYGNGDNLDAAHYKGSTTRGRSQHESINRGEPHKKKNKKQTSHHLIMAKEKKKNWLKIGWDRINPAGQENKKIREKGKTLKSKDSTRQQKSVAKVQQAALKRKRGDVKIADLQAKRKQEMRDRARKRNEAFKKKRAKKNK